MGVRFAFLIAVLKLRKGELGEVAGTFTALAVVVVAGTFTVGLTIDAEFFMVDVAGIFGAVVWAKDGRLANNPNPANTPLNNESPIPFCIFSSIE